MTNFTARVASVATLALALLPAVALSTAHAANAQSPYGAESVQVSDLNLTSASDKAVFVARTDAAARHFCRDERRLESRAACQAGVVAEVTEKASTNTQFASRI